MNRNLISYAQPTAYVPRTTAILGRLGYRIVAADAFAQERERGEAGEPDMLIVDERRLEEVPDVDLPGSPPILLLTGRRGASVLNSRIVGAVRKPAGLHDLYRVAQEIFEDTPRGLPRVATDLAVRCTRDGGSFDGSLVSLSENGGLLRTEGDLPLGACFDLHLELPHSGSIALRAEAAYQLLPGLGIVFSGLAPRARAAIADFVAEAILA